MSVVIRMKEKTFSSCESKLLNAAVFVNVSVFVCTFTHSSVADECVNILKYCKLFVHCLRYKLVVM